MVLSYSSFLVSGRIYIFSGRFELRIATWRRSCDCFDFLLGEVATKGSRRLV
jgi:hypothetical protein